MAAKRELALAPVSLTVDGIRLIDDDGERLGKLVLEAGTVIAVIGRNGAGKTHWLEQLAGLRDPEGLSVSYGEEPLWLPRQWGGKGRRLNPAALVRYGYAAQSPEQALFLRSLEEELVFSLRPYGGSDRAAHVDRALRAVGWDRGWLTADPYRMSGGERRRAALAALFATPAPWLLLDEPTAGLDRDGHDKLAEHLAAMKRAGRGILLVSHDFDWAMPLADRVLILHPGGGIRSCRPEDAIDHPEWLEEAGLSVPVWMAAVRAAWQTEGDSSGRSWDPADVAGRLDDGGFVGVQHDDHVNVRSLASPHLTEAAHPLTGFDPRAVWLGYALFSAGLFSLTSWVGLGAGIAATLAVLAVGKVPLLRWKSIIAGYVYFAVLLAALSALGSAWSATGRIGWNGEAFVGTMFPFARTLAVMLIGLGLPLVMTPLSLRRSLEQIVLWKGRTPVFWQRVVLTVALTIRFVPVLLGEWERFRRIYLARGKETGRSPRAAVRRLRGVTLPFLLALFRLGDEVATALESRGVRRDTIPSRGTRLVWRWKDTALAGGAAILAGMLWLLD